MKNRKFKNLITGLSAFCVAASAIPFIVPEASAADTVSDKVYGDANCNGEVKMNDAVLIMQSIANGDVYGINGTDTNHLTEKGADLADVYERGSGITTMDALSIQKYLIGKITLPESFKEGYTDPVSTGTFIHLKNTSITVEGEYAEVNGTTVTISHSGTFYIDGTLDDGQIAVSIPDETVDPETVKIFLNGVNITGKSAPAILISNAENTSINLVDGTENTVSDGDTTYSGDNLGAAVIEAKDDLTIKGGELGTGSLNVTANTQDGIVCNNDIKINGGNITVTTLNSTDKTNGINGKTSLTVKSGSLTVDAEGDGIKSSKGNVAITGGTISIKAGNDAIQSSTTIDISGGTVIAGGDRGLTGGTVTEGTAINITGGTVIATATDNQSASVGAANQAVMLLNCIDCAENTDLMWKKANAITTGDVSVSKWNKKYKYVLLSDPSIKAGQTYTLTNASTGTAVTHSNGTANTFNVTDSVTAFESVDPSGAVSQTTTPTVTDGYTITLSGASINTNAPADVASINNNVLTISKEGVFTVTGEGTGLQIIVNVDKTAYPNSVVELDLAGMSLTNTSTAPIYVESIGDEVQIVAKKDTVNTISDGTTHSQTYTDSDGNTNNVEGAIFARDDIKFKGTGTLTVNGNQDDAIVCKNDIKIYNGNITVNAVDDGIRGKDSVTIGNDAKSDGSAVDYSNLKLTVNTKTSGDGIKSTATDTASDKSYGSVTINGGTVDIHSYADGIQAEQEFIMNGGDVSIYTYQGSTYTGTGSSSSSGSTGGWGGFGGRPGGGGGMQDGNSNKVDISAKGIKAVGLYDEAGTTWQSKGNITINGGTLNIDSSDDAIHCGGDMFLYGGTYTLASADDGAHSDHNLTIGKGSANTYDDVMITVTKAYEGIEGQNITQNSGTVLVTSTDDGFNAAGGADGSGSGNPGGPGGFQWGQGGMSTSGGSYLMTFNGGLALVNISDGDHDGFDSNGDIKMNGGYQISNGSEPFDCGDSGNSVSVNGSTWVNNYNSVMGDCLRNSASVSATGKSTSANSRVSLVGSDGKVIVSFVLGKSVSNFYAGGANAKSGSAFYTGGTVSGGTELSSTDGKQVVYIGGTLSNGTKLG